MEPWYVATKRFGPWQEAAWSDLNRLEEVVSLDPMLCETVLPEIRPEYWDRIVNEDFMLNFFTVLDFLLRQVAAVPGCIASPETPVQNVVQARNGGRFSSHKQITVQEDEHGKRRQTL